MFCVFVIAETAFQGCFAKKKKKSNFRKKAYDHVKESV